MTGYDLKSHSGKGFLLVKNEGWWAVSLRVTIPCDESVVNQLALPDAGVVVKGGTICVSNNEFVRGLFCAGFHIGKNRDNKKLEALKLAA